MKLLDRSDQRFRLIKAPGVVKEYSLQIEGSTNEPFHLGSGVLLITKMLLYDGTAVQQVFHFVSCHNSTNTNLMQLIRSRTIIQEQLLACRQPYKEEFWIFIRNNSCQKSTIFFFLSIKTKSTEVSSNEGTKRGPVGSLYQFLLTRTYRQLLRGLQVFNNKNINISL